MNTVLIGDIGEAIAIADFTKKGAIISKPLSNNARYDFIADVNNQIYRVQVKATTSIKEDKMVFSTKTTNYIQGRHKSTPYTKEEIDMFYLYCFENNWRGLFILNEEVSPVELKIRLTPAKNGRVKGIRMAEDFEFNKQFDNYFK